MTRTVQKSDICLTTNYYQKVTVTHKLKMIAEAMITRNFQGKSSENERVDKKYSDRDGEKRRKRPIFLVF